jgi:hypothetical protein
MPFTKTGPNQYEGPSGKKFNLNQVRLYYAGGNHFPGQKGFQGTRVKGMATGGMVTGANTVTCNTTAATPKASLGSVKVPSGSQLTPRSHMAVHKGRHVTRR